MMFFCSKAVYSNLDCFVYNNGYRQCIESFIIISNTHLVSYHAERNVNIDKSLDFFWQNDYRFAKSSVMSP